MDISQVIQFEGNVDDLVWKSPVEDFNTSSILVCDETHEALVLVNGTQYGIYRAGRHVLETPNVPIGQAFTNIATNGQTSFPCKVFFVNMLHQMSMNWGIGDIHLVDPVYTVRLNLAARGGANFRVKHTAKFLEKLVGFRDVFSPESLINPDNGMFRITINKYVKSALSKIMISGHVSFVTISENLFEISDVIKEQLNEQFDQYGMELVEFVIEAVNPKKEANYEQVDAAMAAHASRKMQGYTWQDEANVEILKTFAGNQGTAGAMGGIMGGAMVGGVMGASMRDLASAVLSGSNGGSQAPDIVQSAGSSGLDVKNFLNNFGSVQEQQRQHQQQPQQPVQQQPQQPQQPVQQNPFGAAPQQQAAIDPFGAAPQQQTAIDPFGAMGAPTSINPVPVQPVQMNPEPVPQQGPVCVCGNCGASYNKQVKFCTRCGTPMTAPKPKKYCPECGTELEPDDIFCGECGHRFE